jgi:gamma-soluble NSF attachment protein
MEPYRRVAYMNAAKIAQAQNNKVQAAEHFKESAEMWGSHGDVEKCADVLAKAAKELENEKPTEALDLYNRALEILAPDGLTKEQLGKVNINIRDILREAFKYTLKRGEKDSKSLKEALSLAKRMVKQFEAFESEPSMCKSMASVIIILLSLGDVVQADQTYLQEHLDNKHYITSNECKVIDKFIMAFKNSDLDLLDEAQKGENLFYLDPEIQSWAKGLSLFGRGKAAKTGDAKIAREFKGLTLTTVSIPAPAASTPAPAASTTFAPPPPPPTIDDDDDALC